MAEPGAGTPAPPGIRWNLIGEQMVVALLSPGAGDGPDQELVRVVGRYVGQAVLAAVDHVIERGLAEDEATALSLALGLPTDPPLDPATLTDTAATILAMRVQADLTPIIAEAVAEPPAAASTYDGQPSKDDEKTLTASGIQAAAAGVAAWTMDTAKERLDACLEALGPQHQAVWEQRAATAALLDTAITAASFGPFVSVPDTNDGNRVHARIQSRFRQAYGPQPPARMTEIMIERRIHRPSGTLTLAQAKSESRRYRRLWLAMRSPKTTRGSLRLDLAKLDTLTIWEVKPVESLTAGVAQLFYYCSSYNCIALTQSVTDRLVPGPTLSREVLWPVRLSKWTAAEAVSGGVRFAVPFQLAQLPGIVAYVVIRLPDLKEVAAGSAALAAILKEFRTLSKRMRQVRNLGLAGGAANDDEEVDDDLSVAALVLVTVAAVGVGALLLSTAPASATALGIGAAARAAAGAAANALIFGGDAFARPPTDPVAALAPQAPGFDPPVVLQTFAGDVFAGSFPEAVSFLATLCSRVWLGLFAGEGPADP